MLVCVSEGVFSGPCDIFCWYGLKPKQGEISEGVHSANRIVREFLGLAGYHRQFAPNFLKVASFPGAQKSALYLLFAHAQECTGKRQ